MISPNDLEYLTRMRDKIINGCPKCHGRTAFCECQYAFQFEYTKIRANIPIPLREFTLSEVTHPRLTSIIDYTVKYIAAYKQGTQMPNLIISGTNEHLVQGLAAYILEEILRFKKSGYYFPSMYDAKTAATKNWSAKEKKEPDCVALNTADVIVIAGFGTGTETGSAAYGELREVIKTRGANGLLTIFVSRLSFTSLPETEKAVIGINRATEMSCRNWGCTEADDNAATYFTPTVIGGATEEEKKEQIRLDTIAANERAVREAPRPTFVPLTVKKKKRKKATKKDKNEPPTLTGEHTAGSAK